MHDAGLNLRLGEGRLDRLGEASEAIDHGDQHVGHAAVLQVIKHLEPELGAFGLLDPQSEHVLVAGGVDAQGQVHGLVLDGALIADLQSQRVEVDNLVHRIERAGLPLGDFGEHLVGAAAAPAATAQASGAQSTRPG